MHTRCVAFVAVVLYALPHVTDHDHDRSTKPLPNGKVCVVGMAMLCLMTRSPKLYRRTWQWYSVLVHVLIAANFLGWPAMTGHARTQPKYKVRIHEFLAAQVFAVSCPFRSTPLCIASKLLMTLSQNFGIMTHGNLDFFRDDTWLETLLDYFVRVAVPVFINYVTMERVMSRRVIEMREEAQAGGGGGDDAKDVGDREIEANFMILIFTAVSATYFNLFHNTGIWSTVFRKGKAGVSILLGDLNSNCRLARDVYHNRFFTELLCLSSETMNQVGGANIGKIWIGDVIMCGYIVRLLIRTMFHNGRGRGFGFRI